MHIGTYVSNIDRTAFYYLTSLKKITVSDDNPVFTSENGIVGKTDGTLYFGRVMKDGRPYDFIDTIEDMHKKTGNYGKTASFSCGSMRGGADIRRKHRRQLRRYITSATAFGHTEVFEPRLGLDGIKMSQSDKELTITRYKGETVQNTWIFDRDGIRVE